jgi:hypothetical protein
MRCGANKQAPAMAYGNCQARPTRGLPPTGHIGGRATGSPNMKIIAWIIGIIFLIGLLVVLGLGKLIF